MKQDSSEQRRAAPLQSNRIIFIFTQFQITVVVATLYTQQWNESWMDYDTWDMTDNRPAYETISMEQNKARTP